MAVLLVAPLKVDERQFSKGLTDFLHRARTETETVTRTEYLLQRAGFQKLSGEVELEPGARYYVNNRGRALAAFVVGKAPLEAGLVLAAAHIDSPRLDLKAHAVSISEDFCTFQTMPHGRIKSYQWVNRPLALVGRISKKDGTGVDIRLGFRPSEPVFVIADLAPHVDVDHRGRKASEAIKLEELNNWMLA